MDEHILDRVLDTAVLAARTAGKLMKDHAGSIAVDSTKASTQDLVTVIDKACQQVIESQIAAAFPHHAILGEESVPPGADASAAAIEGMISKEWLWVVDPIDGTTNFVHGIPCSVVSIGVAYKGDIVVGVVYEPYRDELFTAKRGRGTYLNGHRVVVSKEDDISRALFAYGLHHTKHVCKTMLRGVGAVADISRGARSLGSAALHLAYVSCGRLTGFWELDLSSWDIAGGSILVSEAGGLVTDTRGAQYSLRTRDVLASNGCTAIHQQVIAALRAVGADVADKPD